MTEPKRPNNEEPKAAEETPKARRGYRKPEVKTNEAFESVAATCLGKPAVPSAS